MPSKMSEPLSPDALYQLANILDGFTNKTAMNIEEVDGLFAALHCSPELVSFNDYLPLLWGDETGEEDAPFDGMDTLKEFLDLLMRHWNNVGLRFQNEVFFPCLKRDEKTSEEKGNDWAKGFLKGFTISGCLEEIMNDEKEIGILLPILILAHEHDEDPKNRPFKKDISKEDRQDLLDCLCEAVMLIYRRFASQRKIMAKQEREKEIIKKDPMKVGRNELCSCGSGIKFKKCCLRLYN